MTSEGSSPNDVTKDAEPTVMTGGAGPDRGTWPRSAVLALLLALAGPLLLSLASRDWLFSPAGIDAYRYVGFFLHYDNPLFNPGDYKLARLPWVLSGFSVHHVLPPVPAALALHLGFLELSTAACFVALYTLFGRPLVALTWSAVLGVSADLVGSKGWDYHNTGAGAFYLLAVAAAALGSAAGRRRWLWCLAIGACTALAVHSNITLLNVAPFPPVLFLLRSRLLPPARTIRSHVVGFLWMAVGAAGITGGLGLINVAVGREFLFFQELVDLVTRFVADPQNQVSYRHPWSTLWFLRNDYMALFLVTGLACAGGLWLAGRGGDEKDRVARLAMGGYLALLVLMFAWQLAGQTALDFDYMAFPLFPHVFLGLAAVHYVCVRRAPEVTPRAYCFYPVILVLPLALGVRSFVPVVAYPVLLLGAAYLLTFGVAFRALRRHAVAVGTGLLVCGLALTNSLSASTGSRTLWNSCRTARHSYDFAIAAAELWQRLDPGYDRMTLWWDADVLPPDQAALPESARCLVASENLGLALHGMFPAYGRRPMPTLEAFVDPRLFNAASTGGLLMTISGEADPLQRVARSMRTVFVSGTPVATERVVFARQTFFATVYQLTAAVPDTVRATRSPLATVTAEGLLQGGEMNQYGSRSRPLLQPRGEGALLVPTTFRDHVATPMLPVPAGAGWVEARVTPAMEGSGLCRLQLQDRDYAPLGTIGCVSDDGAPVVRTFRLAPGTRAVRLVLTSRTMQPVLMPAIVELSTLNR